MTTPWPTAPVPVNKTLWGLPAASSVMVMVPVRVPVVVGLKVTVKTQVAPAARLLLQLLVWAKSPAVAMLVMLNGPLPVFFRAAGWAGLVVPTA